MRLCVVPSVSVSRGLSRWPCRTKRVVGVGGRRQSRLISFRCSRGVYGACDNSSLAVDVLFTGRRRRRQTRLKPFGRTRRRHPRYCCLLSEEREATHVGHEEFSHGHYLVVVPGLGYVFCLSSYDRVMTMYCVVYHVDPNSNSVINVVAVVIDCRNSAISPFC